CDRADLGDRPTCLPAHRGRVLRDARRRGQEVDLRSVYDARPFEAAGFLPPLDCCGRSPRPFLIGTELVGCCEAQRDEILLELLHIRPVGDSVTEPSPHRSSSDQQDHRLAVDLDQITPTIDDGARRHDGGDGATGTRDEVAGLAETERAVEVGRLQEITGYHLDRGRDRCGRSPVGGRGSLVVTAAADRDDRSHRPQCGDRNDPDEETAAPHHWPAAAETAPTPELDPSPPPDTRKPPPRPSLWHAVAASLNLSVSAGGPSFPSPLMTTDEAPAEANVGSGMSTP